MSRCPSLRPAFGPGRPVPASHGRLVAVAAVLLACGWAHAEDLPSPDEAKPLDEKAARRVIEDAISQAANPAAASPSAKSAPTNAAAADSLLVARISAEVAAKQLEAKRLSQKSPADALDLLDTTAKGLNDQPLPEETKTQILRRIERTRRDIEEATGKRRNELAMEKQASQVEAQVDRERSQKVEVDQRIAMLIEEYNTLVDERRFAEAEAIAKKAGQLAPDNAVVRQLLAQSRMIRRLDAQKSIDGERQAGFLDVAEDVEASGTPFAGPIKFPETKDWQDLTKSRSQRLAEGRSRATAAEASGSKAQPKQTQ